MNLILMETIYLYIKGKVSYEEVEFGFNTNGNLQLHNINIDIKAGTFVGLVGTSGSGKSTLVKLLARLYNPNKGIIKIDDIDIKKVDLFSVRSQIGIVSQDSLLFKGTIQENIALSKPNASYEEIVNAAKVANANEFISNLDGGYSYLVDEKDPIYQAGNAKIAIAKHSKPFYNSR